MQFNEQINDNDFWGDDVERADIWDDDFEFASCGETYDNNLKPDTTEMIRYIKLLHKGSQGYVALYILDSYGYGSMWSNKIERTYSSLTNSNSILVSMNTFESKYYRAHCLEEIKALYVDLNVYRTKYSKDEALNLLENEYIGYKIPRPTFIIDTGGGLRMEFLLDDTPYDKLELWESTQRYLYDTLTPLGADKESIKYTVLNTIPGSINKVNNLKVEIIKEEQVKYNLDNIYFHYVATLEERFLKIYEENVKVKDIEVPLSSVYGTVNFKKIPETRVFKYVLPKEKFTSALSYIELLYGKDYKGNCCIWSKDGRWNNEVYTDRETKECKDVKFHFYKCNEIPKKGYNIPNLFLSINSFKRRKRLADNVESINALFVDLDIYNKNISKKDTIYNLEQDYFDKLIPKPSLVVDSGGGLYLIWILNKHTTPLLPLEEAKRYFSNLEKYLIDKLDSVGSDTNARDLARVLRIPGSSNSKYEGTPKVKILRHTGYEYDLKKLAKLYVPHCVNKDISTNHKLLLTSNFLQSMDKEERDKLLIKGVVAIHLNPPLDPIQLKELEEKRAREAAEAEAELKQIDYLLGGTSKSPNKEGEEKEESSYDKLMKDINASLNGTYEAIPKKEHKQDYHAPPYVFTDMDEIMKYVREYKLSLGMKPEEAPAPTPKVDIHDDVETVDVKNPDSTTDKYINTDVSTYAALTSDSDNTDYIDNTDNNDTILTSDSNDTNTTNKSDYIEDIDYILLEDIELPPKDKRITRACLTAIGASILKQMPQETVKKIKADGTTYSQPIYHIKGNYKEKYKNDIKTKLLSGQIVHDIELLCRLRNYKLIGCRHNIITYHLHYSCYYLKDYEKAYERTRNLCSKIINSTSNKEAPYTKEEFMEAVKAVINQYKNANEEVNIYSNDYLVKQLKLTDSECRATDKLALLSHEEIAKYPKVELDLNSEFYVPFMIQLITPLEKILRRKQTNHFYYLRNRDKRPPKPINKDNKRLLIQQEIEERALKVLELTKQGKGSTDITKILDISRATVKRDKALLRKKGLL